MSLLSTTFLAWLMEPSGLCFWYQSSLNTLTGLLALKLIMCYFLACNLVYRAYYPMMFSYCMAGGFGLSNLPYSSFSVMVPLKAELAVYLVALYWYCCFYGVIFEASDILLLASILLLLSLTERTKYIGLISNQNLREEVFHKPKWIMMNF